MWLDRSVCASVLFFDAMRRIHACRPLPKIIINVISLIAAAGIKPACCSLSAGQMPMGANSDESLRVSIILIRINTSNICCVSESEFRPGVELGSARPSASCGSYDIKAFMPDDRFGSSLDCRAPLIVING